MSEYSSRPFEAILFDLGSTLIYYDGDITADLADGTRILVQRLAAAGLDFDQQLFFERFNSEMLRYYRERDTEFIEYTTDYLLKKILLEFGLDDVPAPVIERAVDALYKYRQACWKPEADCHTTLEALRSAGYKLGLISNASSERDVQALVDMAGLREFFTTIKISAALGIRKPNPGIFWAALDELSADSGKAAMVGDTLGADILGAMNAGIYSIWLTRRADTPGNRAHAGTIYPDAIISTLAELIPFLQQTIA